MAPQYFLRTTYIHNKYMYTIRAYYLQYCGSYAPHRRRRTMDDGRWRMDTGRWTMDAGPSTPYFKLTGELKIKLKFWRFQGQFDLVDQGQGRLHVINIWFKFEGKIQNASKVIAYTRNHHTEDDDDDDADDDRTKNNSLPVLT